MENDEWRKKIIILVPSLPESCYVCPLRRTDWDHGDELECSISGEGVEPIDTPATFINGRLASCQLATTCPNCKGARHVFAGPMPLRKTPCVSCAGVGFWNGRKGNKGLWLVGFVISWST